MKCIASFVERSREFPVNAAVGDVAEAFATLPGAQAFAVSDVGGVVGLIYREAVERELRAAVEDAPRAGDLMIRGPLTVDGAMDVREAIEILAASGDPALAVMDGKTCLGVASLRSLVDALMLYRSERDIAADEERISGAVAQEFQRLASTAQGEFRGQVHGLLAMTDRLARQHLNPDALAQVESIRATGEALLRLADDALDMVQARQGRLELSPRAQLLRELADQVQDRWSARATDAGVGLLISYDGDPDLSATVDPERLIQVFDNLIENALRYTRQGSVEVGLKARAEGEQIMLEGRVRDTGPGLSGAKLARIFDPDSEGGSLPLSLTRSIVLSMKGSIRAESNLGQGMTIVFDMMAEAAATVIAAPPVQERAVSAPHVLVVDDNATNRMVAEALCEMFDCTSETVEDGVEAVEAARSGRFDIILMDIKMPRMDGIAATKAIRALGGEVRDIPIVALTANVDPEDARSYLAAGMCCVVEKPIKPDRLLQAINLALASGANEDARVAAA